MRKKRKLLLSLAAVVILVIAGYLYGDNMMPSGGRPRNDSQPTAGEALTTTVVRRGDIVRYVTASGNLQPNQRVELAFHTGGRVEEVYVAVGDRVAAGTALARLNNRQQELAFMRAKTQYEIAVIDSTPNVVMEREYDMESAAETLEHTILRAPFDGLVTDVRIIPGETVSTSVAAVTMIDDSSYKVEVSIDELDVAQLQRGQSAIINFDADRGHPRRGFVDYIGHIANVQQSIVTVPVVIRIQEADAALRPGYTSTVQIAVTEARGVIRVPVEAVHVEAGSSYVTKLEDGEATVVAVTTGVTDGVWMEIVSGINEGDEIIGLNYRTGQGGRSVPASNQFQTILRDAGGGSFGAGSSIRR